MQAMTHVVFVKKEIAFIVFLCYMFMLQYKRIKTIKLDVFCDVALCSLEYTDRHFRDLTAFIITHHPDDGDSKLL
jgi:hypothetical protein